MAVHGQPESVRASPKGKLLKPSGWLGPPLLPGRAARGHHEARQPAERRSCSDSSEHSMTLADLQGRATITVEEAAEVLGVSRGLAYEAVRTGDLPALRIGRRVLIPVPQFLSLLGRSNGTGLDR